MSTDSKVTFDANIQRAHHFLQIHKETGTGVGRPVKRRAELPRAALVFAVGSLDAYLSELNAEVIIGRMVSGASVADYRNVIGAIQRAIPSLALEVALVGDEEERVGRIRAEIVDHFHNRVSNHGADAVARSVELIGGQPKKLWRQLTDEGYGNAPARIDEWTETRHAIVHRGESPSVPVRKTAYPAIGLITRTVQLVDEIACGLLGYET